MGEVALNRQIDDILVRLVMIKGQVPAVFALSLPACCLVPATFVVSTPLFINQAFCMPRETASLLILTHFFQVYPHILGIHPGRMALPSEVIKEEPVYVNAKQYKRIMMRRQCRAKAESENKLAKPRKVCTHDWSLFFFFH